MAGRRARRRPARPRCATPASSGRTALSEDELAAALDPANALGATRRRSSTGCWRRAPAGRRDGPPRRRPAGPPRHPPHAAAPGPSALRARSASRSGSSATTSRGSGSAATRSAAWSSCSPTRWRRAATSSSPAAARSRNWAMLAALAARTRGLDSTLVSFGDPPAGGAVGNHALAVLAGARLHFTGDADRSSVGSRRRRRVPPPARRRARTPYGVHRGGATGARRPRLRAGHRRAGRPADGDRRPAASAVARHRFVRHPGRPRRRRARGCRPSYDVVGVTVSRPADECRERVAPDRGRTRAALLDVAAPDLQVEVRRRLPRPGQGRALPGGRRGGRARRPHRGRLPRPGVRRQGDGGRSLAAATPTAGSRDPSSSWSAAAAPTLFTV